MLFQSYDSYAKERGWAGVMGIPDWKDPGNANAAQQEGPVWWKQDVDFLPDFARQVGQTACARDDQALLALSLHFVVFTLSGSPSFSVSPLAS